MAMLRVLILLVLAGYGSLLTAQISDSSQSSESQDSASYIIMSSRDAVYTLIEGREIDSLSYDVVLTQDSLVMKCNRAVVIDQINALAYGNVIIIHQDSTIIYSDSLDYDGISKDAVLLGEVILIDGVRQLYTYRLDYNTESRIAVYEQGATMLLENGKLLSRRGVYDGKKKTAVFKENVRFEDSLQVVLADSMKYYFDEERIDFLSPVNIFRDSTEIYSEQGVFSQKLNRTILSQNVQVRTTTKLITCGVAEILGDSSIYNLYFDPLIIDDDGSIASGDTVIYNEKLGEVKLLGHAYYKNSKGEVTKSHNITYNEKTEEYFTNGSAEMQNGTKLIKAGSFSKVAAGAKASGGVIIEDQENKTKIWGDESINIDSTNTSIVYRTDGSKSLMQYELEGDSLFLLAGLLANQEINDSDTVTYNVMDASEGIRLIKKNISGLSDSLNYGAKDSIIWLIGRPILWSDSTQLTADTIALYIINNSISKVELIENAMIAFLDSATIYNQIKGRRITNLLENGTIRSSTVVGNAEIFYFVKSKSEYVGVNNTKANSMLFTFVNGEIDRINMNGNQESTVSEYEAGKDYSLQYLKGFVWRWEEKPSMVEFIRMMK
jgi:lipopolysaccharide export system protein LptA